MLRNKKINIYLCYCVLFIIFYFCVFSPFILYGKAYLWSSDGMSQHYPSLIYTKEWTYQIVNSIKNGSISIPFWNLNLGFGQDVFGNAINFRIFNFLYVFFSDLPIETYLTFRVIASLFLCGIAFICFAKTKSDNFFSVLFGALVYVFSGFTLFFATRHPFFLEMMFYLPLMLRGIDITFEKKKSGTFIAIVFFSAISYFYFLYMITLPAIIYGIFRIFEINKKTRFNVKKFLKIVFSFFWQYLFGLLLAAFSLIPTIIRSFDSSRTNLETGINYLHWDLAYYKEFFSGILNVDQIGIYGFIAMSGISFFCIMYMIFSCNEKKNLYLGQIIIYTATFLVPFLSLAFSGFAGRTQRWCFIYTFWTAMIVVEMLPKILEKNKAVFLKSCLCLTGYIFIYLIIYGLDGEKISSGILCAFLYTIVLIIINCTDILERKRKYICLIFVGMLCLEMTMKSYDLYSPQGENYISDFATQGSVEAEGSDNSSSALNMVEDNTVYRVDVVSVPLSQKYNQMNYGLRNYVNGISSYYSLSDERICQYSLDLGNSQQNIKFLILDWAQRTALNELASVKYLTTTDSCNERIPYGYELIGAEPKYYSNGDEETEYLYENTYALPIMYSYDSYISKKDYENLGVNEKEQAMLQGVVLEENIDYPRTQLDFDYQILLDKNYILDQMRTGSNGQNNVEIHDDYLEIKEDNTQFTLSIPQGMEGEIYWIMEDAEFRSVNYLEEQLAEAKGNISKYDWQILKAESNNWEADDTSSITVSMDNYKDTCTLLNNTYQYYFGARDFLLNIGYTTTGNSITVTFARAGKYSFNDMKLVIQPMDTYGEKVEKLKEASIEDITVETNRIYGVIESDQPKILCVSVPYSKGWKAYINGKETEIMPANGMYMALEIDAGVSSVELEYVTPGFYLGCLVSCISAGGMCAIIITTQIISRIKQKKRTKS